MLKSLLARKHYQPTLSAALCCMGLLVLFTNTNAASASVTNYSWIKWIAGSAIAVSLLFGIGALILFLFNKQLKSEIDKRIKVEEALKESEERLRTAGKAAYDLIYELDVASNALKWFGDIDRLLGYGEGEVSKNARAWLDLIHPEDRDKLDNAVQRHRTSTQPVEYEYRMRHRDGTYRHWKDHGLPLLDDQGFPYKWIGVCTDITEHKRAEDAMKAFFDQSLVMLFIADMQEKTLVRVNNEVLRITGRSEEDVQAMPFIDFIYPENRESMIEAMTRLTDGKPLIGYQSRHFCADGESRLFEWNAVPDIERKLVYAMAQDITERLQAEGVLRTAQERFLTVLDSIDSTIYVADMETYEILFMNKYMIESFGRDMTGEICWDVFRGNSGPCAHCSNDQLVDQNGEPSGVYIWQDKNPITDKWYIYHDRAIEWTDRRLVRLQIAMDITDFKRMEEELLQSHKLEAIGTLAGGVAHEFNNILSIIIGNIDQVLNDYPERNSGYDSLEEIKTAGLRAKDIVSRLLAFSRKTGEQLKPVKIGPVIKDSLKFLRPTLPVTIDIRQDIQVMDSTVLADPTQINQVMINLCVNASNAMEETGGTLEINVVKVRLGDDSINSYPDLADGDYVKISVSDTGPGVAPEIIDRIFDPYFTTNELGKDSGMGLAVVQGIVKNHNGAIYVDSPPGQGATFTMLFPLIAQKPVMEVKTIDKIPCGNETVLIVDDEEAIAKLTGRMLERLGYSVEIRINPVEAFDLFQFNPEGFDLVITDMTMPQMTGATLSKKLKSIRADIPVIICTGYSALINEQKAKELGIAAYIIKPVIMEEIARTIRKVLDESRGSIRDYLSFTPLKWT